MSSFASSTAFPRANHPRPHIYNTGQRPYRPSVPTSRHTSLNAANTIPNASANPPTYAPCPTRVRGPCPSTSSVPPTAYKMRPQNPSGQFTATAARTLNSQSRSAPTIPATNPSPSRGNNNTEKPWWESGKDHQMPAWWGSTNAAQPTQSAVSGATFPNATQASRQGTGTRRTSTPRTAPSGLAPGSATRAGSPQSSPNNALTIIPRAGPGTLMQMSHEDDDASCTAGLGHVLRSVRLRIKTAFSAVSVL